MLDAANDGRSATTKKLRSEVLGRSFEWNHVLPDSIRFQFSTELKKQRPVILCQVVHKKFSHSQFSQLGSRKGRNDSNLFDPSGSISLNTRDNAQALRLSLVDSIHCSNAMNLHGHTETGLNLNGSNSGAGEHVWPLDESRASACMLRVEQCTMIETCSKAFL